MKLGKKDAAREATRRMTRKTPLTRVHLSRTLERVRRLGFPLGGECSGREHFEAAASRANLGLKEARPPGQGEHGDRQSDRAQEGPDWGGSGRQ